MFSNSSFRIYKWPQIPMTSLHTMERDLKIMCKSGTPSATCASYAREALSSFLIDFFPDRGAESFALSVQAVSVK